MVLPPVGRKFLLAGHLVCSVGWLGAVVAYLALGVAATTSTDALLIRGAWLGMERIGWYAIVPLAVIAWATGVALALTTRWGLFRHYWVLISLVLTSVALGVLLVHMPDVSATAEVARIASADRLEMLGGDLPHPAVGLVVLLVVHVLNVYKPRGMTAHGRRRSRPPG